MPEVRQASFSSGLPSALYAAPETKTHTEEISAAAEQPEPPAPVAEIPVASFGSVAPLAVPVEIHEQVSAEPEHHVEAQGPSGGPTVQ